MVFKERESWVRGWKEETGMSGEKRAGAEEESSRHSWCQCFQKKHDEVGLEELIHNKGELRSRGANLCTTL